MACEVVTKRCQHLYQQILAKIEAHVVLQPHSADFSSILSSCICEHEKELQELIATNGGIQQKENLLNPDSDNNSLAKHNVNSNKNDDAESLEESHKTNLLNEFDKQLRNQVSHIFSDTVNNVAMDYDEDDIDTNLQNQNNAIVMQRSQRLMIETMQQHNHQCSSNGIRSEIEHKTIVTQTIMEREIGSKVIMPAKKKSKPNEQNDIEKEFKRRYSMGDCRLNSDIEIEQSNRETWMLAEKLERIPSTSKESAMKKRHSSLRKTLSSRRELKKISQKNNKTLYKNINRKMHAHNELYRDLCQICNIKDRFMVKHYANVHPEYEVLISRPSPKMADKLRKQINEFKIVNKKIAGFCFFCEEQKNMTKCNWSEHLLIHTGEKRFNCSACPFESNRKADHKDCSKVAQNIYDANSDDANLGSLMAFICNKCNYLQIRREQMVKHLMKQHGYQRILEENQFQKVLLIPDFHPAKSDIEFESKFIEPKKCYECTICFVKCENAEAFEKHFDQTHYRKIQQYNCICGEKLKNENAITSEIITAHLMGHNGDLYECMNCNEVFFDKDIIQNHLLNDHTNCRFKYRHIEKLTNSSQQTTITEIIFEKISCKLCLKYFKKCKFEEALKHFERKHQTETVEICGSFSKKITRMSKKPNEIETHYLSGNEFVIEF